MPTTILHSRDGVLDAVEADQLAALNARLAQGPAKILLHLHGGLVPQASGPIANSGSIRVPAGQSLRILNAGAIAG